MLTQSRLIGFLISALSVATALALSPKDKDKHDDRQPVRMGPEGKLIYEPDAQGNVIPDFSYVGYMGGGVRLPWVPVKAELATQASGDDTARIQKALDEVGRLPMAVSGFRGALLLKKGTYRIAGTLHLNASGVVLRGEGSGEKDTLLLDTSHKQQTTIMVGDGTAPHELTQTRQKITDASVPLGARTFSVASAAGFKVGDRVMVRRPSTQEWIHTIGMDRLIHPWQPGSKDLTFMRSIVKIEGSRLTIDAPLCNNLKEKFGGGEVTGYEWNRITQVAVEDLRGDSEYRGKEDESHGWNLVQCTTVENAWVKNVTSIHFGYSCVNLGRWAKSVTVEDCQCLDPVSQIIGGRRYSFAIAGQQNLVQRCFARNGRHDFVMHASVPGPNVFYDCRSEESHADSGPHHRWSCGTLYDNVEAGGPMNVQNRGNSGTGHGWAGAYMVFWNCRAKSMDIQKPPTAENYAIGCRASSTKGTGLWVSADHPVEPHSLYLAQLKERLGEAAITNIAKEAARPAVDMTPLPAAQQPGNHPLASPDTPHEEGE